MDGDCVFCEDSTEGKYCDRSCHFRDIINRIYPYLSFVLGSILLIGIPYFFINFSFSTLVNNQIIRYKSLIVGIFIVIVSGVALSILWSLTTVIYSLMGGLFTVLLGDRNQERRDSSNSASIAVDSDRSETGIYVGGTENLSDEENTGVFTYLYINQNPPNSEDSGAD